MTYRLPLWKNHLAPRKNYLSYFWSKFFRFKFENLSLIQCRVLNWVLKNGFDWIHDIFPGGMQLEKKKSKVFVLLNFNKVIKLIEKVFMLLMTAHWQVNFPSFGNRHSLSCLIFLYLFCCKFQRSHLWLTPYGAVTNYTWLPLVLGSICWGFSRVSSALKW